KEVAYQTVDEAGQRADGGRFLRLQVTPELVRGPAVLEVSCQVPAARAGGGLFQTALTPPSVRGAPPGAPVRWAAELPAGWVVLSPEGGPGADRSWVWRTWLFVVQPSATNGDLERWFTAGLPPAQVTPPPDEVAAAHPSLVAWRGGTEPITVTHAPGQAWLLTCSLTLIVLGGVVAVAARRRRAEG